MPPDPRSNLAIAETGRSAGYRWQFEAIGTHWTIDTTEPVTRPQTAEIAALIDDFDRTWSRFRPDSLVHRLAGNGGAVRLPGASVLLGFYRQLYDATDGAVTPLIGRSLEVLGYDAHYTLRPSGNPRPAPRWDDVLQVRGDVVRARGPVVLDVGAAGKGRLVDLVQQALIAAGHQDLLVDAGGDIAHAGTGPARIGLEHPGRADQVIGVAELGTGAIAGSATSRRRWGPGLHHIVDPRTGRPTQGVWAGWVVAPTAMVADGLSTALFVADPAVVAGWSGTSAVVVTDDGGVRWSDGFPGEVFR